MLASDGIDIMELAKTLRCLKNNTNKQFSRELTQNSSNVRGKLQLLKWLGVPESFDAMDL